LKRLAAEGYVVKRVKSAAVGVEEGSPALVTSAHPSAATAGAVKFHDSTKSSLVWLEQLTRGEPV
jgi:hypothetical protein